jgi:hypothetical protein
MPRRRLLAVCALAIVSVSAACGGDGGDNDSGSTPASSATPAQSAVNVSTATPTLDGPASKYSITLDDIGLQWFTNIAKTLVIDRDFYANSDDVFATPADGQRLLAEWGYQEGYETAFIPEGRDQAVLVGSYYIVQEVHRFATAEGAAKAFQYYRDSIHAPANKSAVGNRAVAFTGIGTKIPKTDVNSQFEQVIFQRGNVVAIVLATGAQGFMKSEYAWKLAVMVDEKLLGIRASIEPTPISNYKTPTPEPASCSSRARWLPGCC